MLRPAARRRPAHRARSTRVAGVPPGAAGVLLSLAAALLLATAGAAERPKIYKWVDSNGIAHYTTDPARIPKPLRDRIESIDRSRPAPAPEEAAARPTPAREAASPPSPETAPSPSAEIVGPEIAGPETATPTTTTAAPAPRPAVAPPSRGTTLRSPNAWFERDALPRAPDASILASGQATPEQLDALAAEREALDGRIAEVQAEIHRDERFLKGLISDPELDADIPLFDRPDFLEVSRRLPELQARLQELRDERAKLETP